MAFRREPQRIEVKPMWVSRHKLTLPSPEEALLGRVERMRVPPAHFVNGAPLEPPFPAGTELALFGLGCFWGAERKFWQTPGVVSTSVGYAGGLTPKPTYEEVCSGRTGHAEVVRVVFDPSKVTYGELLRVFQAFYPPGGSPRESWRTLFYANLVSGFLDEILDPLRTTDGDFTDAAWVQEVINAVERWYRERRWVGLPLDAASS